jgi:hypothetical protein
MLTAFLVAVLLLASTTPALRVEISSPKSRVATFEPVKLTVWCTALRPVSVPSTVDTTGYPLLETWVDYGQGYVRYLDDDGRMLEGVEGVGRSLEAGDRFVETLVLVNGPMDRPTVPFPSAGRFPLRVVVRSPEGVVLGESKPITFDVVAPEGDDAAVVQRIRSQPWVLRGGLPEPTYAALVAEYPASPYTGGSGPSRWRRAWDDGCVPADDVVGAELGTDDREFDLRAERKGSGTGRTYLITYAVADALGNKAQPTTAVVVQHDQGKKK